MSIEANVSGGQQITASVGETQIDVAVSGGVGPTGTAGAAASIAVGTVTTGAPGSSASVVNAGSSSAAVLNFTIPAGAAGATGATGPAGATGATGAQGPAGTTSWDGITDKPATFAPSSHTHTASAITDFTTAAAAAAPVQSVNGLTGSVVVIATYATAESFPATGNAATLYVETDTGRVYQWTGSVYAETGIDSASGQHASQHGAAGSDPITIATSQITNFSAAAAAAAPVQSVNGSTGAVTVSTGKPLGLILALT